MKKNEKKNLLLLASFDDDKFPTAYKAVPTVVRCIMSAHCPNYTMH